MKRIIFALYLAALVALALPAAASLAPVTQTIITHDYGTQQDNVNPGTFYAVGPTYGLIRENTFSDTFSYEVPDAGVASFDVTIRYTATDSTWNPENWYVAPGGVVPSEPYLLQDASGFDWKVESFTFTAAELGSLFDTLSGGTFTLMFRETTNTFILDWLFPDTFALDYAKLTVNGKTSPVPLPGAALLLGSALLALTGVRRRAN